MNKGTTILDGIISKHPAQKVLTGICLCLMIFSSVYSFGQSSATGLPPFNSFASSGVDNINLNNLNISIEIPLYERKGRGIDLQLSLFYNSVNWAKSPPFYNQPWIPASRYFSFWQTALAHTYTVNWQQSPIPTNCGLPGPDDLNAFMSYYGFTVTEGNGTVHSYPAIQYTDQNYECYGADASYGAQALPENDPSALQLVVDFDQWGTLNNVQVIEKDGTIFNPRNSTITDRNGNMITSSIAQQPLTIVDTQGQVALSEVASDPSTETGVWIYPTATGTASFEVHYSRPRLVPNFPCGGNTASGISISLVDSITLASGQSYTFQYDQVGRITYLKVPTGGIITYSYPGPINCLSPRNMAEDTAIDRTVDGAVTSYRKTPTGTQVTFPNGSVVNHTIDPYWGRETDTTGNGTITHTCWNSNGAFCTSGNAGDGGNTMERLSIQRINTEDGSTSNRFEAIDYLGNLTETREYDYGNNNVNAPDRRTVITYNSYYPPMPAENQLYDHGVLANDTRYFYDQGSTSATQPGSPQHAFVVDGSRRNLTQTDRWVGGTAWVSERRTYFDTGNVASFQDANGNITTYTYGGCGSSFLTQTNHPASLVDYASWECNSAQPATTTDIGGVTTHYSYSDPAFSRITQRSRSADGASTVFSYDEVALKQESRTRASSSAGSSPGRGWTDTIQLFDDLGRLNRSFNLNGQGQWETVDTSYDSVGNKSFVTTPYFSSGISSTKRTLGTGDSYLYDAFNRLTQINHTHDGVVDTEHHSYSGRDYATIDEANKQHFYRTDAFGRLQQVCEVTGSGNDSSCGLGLSGNGYTTVYAYDAQNNLLRVDQKGSAPADSTQWRSRQFTYDRLGRLLTAANPESGTIFYAYDANGNLLQKTGPAANQAGTATQTTSFCYDGMNRITGKAYSAQTCQNGYLPQGLAAVSYVYDIGANAAKGHLTSWTDQAGSANYSYDVAGHISSEQRTLNGVPNPITKTAGYTYNPDDSLATLTYPSGAVVTYAPDSAGRFLSAVDVGHNTSYVTAAVYSAGGSIATFVSGSSSTFAGITNAFVYNDRLQLCRRTASSMGAVPTNCTNSSGNLLDLSYDLHSGNGDNGNVYGVTNNRDISRSQSFTYDALNRLATAQNAGTDCAQTVIGKTKFWGNSYSYDAWGNLLGKSVTKCSAENIVLAATSNNQLLGYGYDAAGNMTSDPTDGVTATYDAENRISAATRNSATTTYTYDEGGNRVKKTSNGMGTLYWYMTPGIVGESDLSGNLKTEYIFFDGERVARRDYPGNTVSYYFSDHLKTASVVTDATGTVLDESDYYPWGGELQFVNNLDNHYKFTGKERDSETGLDYFGARYYSNGLGRFITPDWAAKATAVPYADFADPQSLNLYTYVRNIPTTNVDADGHLFFHWHFLITYAAGVRTGHGPFHGVFSSFGKAARNALVDFRKGAQEDDAAHTNMHAMRGRKPDGTTQSGEEAKAAIAQVVTNAMQNGDTALAGHDVIDAATPGHQGEIWPGVHLGMKFFKHLLGDIFPSPATVKQAYQNEKAVLQGTNPLVPTPKPTPAPPPPVEAPPPPPPRPPDRDHEQP